VDQQDYQDEEDLPAEEDDRITAWTDTKLSS
jgi:hypothetical protein